MDKPSLKKVLVVDDEKASLFLYKVFLQKEGLDVICVSSPLLALQALKDQGVDAIISDISMPEMNGFEFLKTLKKSNLHKGPIILVTASHLQDIPQSDEQGIAKIFEKPCRFQELAHFVRLAVH